MPFRLGAKNLAHQFYCYFTYSCNDLLVVSFFAVVIAKELSLVRFSLFISILFLFQERFYFGDNVLPCFESGIPLLKSRLQQLPDSDNVSMHHVISLVKEIVCASWDYYHVYKLGKEKRLGSHLYMSLSQNSIPYLSNQSKIRQSLRRSSGLAIWISCSLLSCVKWVSVCKSQPQESCKFCT